MKVDVGVFGQPSIAFLVGAIIIQYHMQLLIGGSFSHDLIHELQEFLTPLQLRNSGLDLSSRYLQRREKIECAVALVGTFKAANDLTIIRFHVAGLALQG